MISAPIAPSADDDISATWMRRLVSYVRAIRPIAGPGVKSRVTPNGTILTCGGVRGASAAGGAPDRGCWKIVGGTREEEPVRLFGNQYYAAGEVLHQTELDDAVEDFVCQGELGEDEEYTEDDLPYVALKIPATAGSTEEPQLVGYKTFRELVAEQKDPAYVVRALYKFWHDGSVAIDFRNCQMLQVAEFVDGGDDSGDDDGENSGETGEYDGGEEVLP